MTDNQWPSEENLAAPRTYLAAFGQVNLVYNLLEGLMGNIFQYVAPLDAEDSKRLFHSLNNRERIDLLCALVRKNELDFAPREAILHCVLCYDICTDNRNILAHVVTLDINETAAMWSKRAANDPLKTIIFHISLAELREVADQIADVLRYAAGIDFFLFHRAYRNPNWSAPPPPLPDKLPKPRKLTTYQPEAAHKDVPFPPRSSGA